MKLKNIFALALLAVSFTACETVDEDERFIGPVEFAAKKNVLIEDFTGQRCVNCPRATDAILSLQNTYGHDHVIAVALHGGPLSLPATTPVGLATEESQEYNTKWKVDSWPKGMINRKGGLFEFSSWSAQVIYELQQEPEAKLNTTVNSFDKETGKLSISVDVTGNLTADASLQVWLTENKIIKVQFMPDGPANPAYEHNHVFRSSVNGTWGEEIKMVKDETLTKQYEYTFDAKNQWNPENMSIVTFVSNETNGVMQVIETPVIKK